MRINENIFLKQKIDIEHVWLYKLKPSSDN